MPATNPFHKQLLDSSIYPETTQFVDYKETHISCLYLTDNHVYKFKKPLDLGFLDYTTLDKRHHFCQEEVRLNRRFTTDVYLGVAALRQSCGQINFGDSGKIVDFAVKMRRLPEDRMLDRLIEADDPEIGNEISRLGTALHTFRKQSETCRNEAVSGTETVASNCLENFSQTRSAIGTCLTSEAHTLLQKITRQELVDLKWLMRKREAKGFVRDGHGDLHTGNICMTEPICIYDCIEFNRRFRVADVLADLAFLIMDLEFRGRRELADRVAADYRSLSLDCDFTPLLLFYKRYRAMVRGKVDAMLATDLQASAETRDSALQLARSYFSLALGYQLKTSLFLTAGLMGTGKTTLARSLAQAVGAVHLRSDVVRKQLAGQSPEEANRDNFGTGLYSAAMTGKVYAELLGRAAAILPQQSVIIDASFARESERKKFFDCAENAGCPVWLLHLQCPDEVALQRLDQRTGDASDGRRELFAAQKASFRPIKETGHEVPVDTSLSVYYNVQSLLCRVLTGQEQQPR